LVSIDAQTTTINWDNDQERIELSKSANSETESFIISPEALGLYRLLCAIVSFAFLLWVFLNEKILAFNQFFVWNWLAMLLFFAV
jgi:hypothetical protein